MKKSILLLGFFVAAATVLANASVNNLGTNQGSWNWGSGSFTPSPSAVRINGSGEYNQPSSSPNAGSPAYSVDANPAPTHLSTTNFGSEPEQSSLGMVFLGLIGLVLHYLKF